MRLAWILVPTLMVGLSGCGPSTIDSSSDEALKQSLEEVRADVPEESRKAYDEDLQVVMGEAARPGGVSDASRDLAEIQRQIRTTLQGKTAADVSKLADGIRAAQHARQREQMLGEIAELQAKQSSASAAKAQLAKFEITRSRYFKQKRQYVGEQPVIEMSVKNGTDQAVSRAYFVGTVASPGRSVPWLKDEFNYAISGGLEPGESADWSLAPNMFSDWGRLDAPADAVLTVEVTRLDGANEEPLFDVDTFGKADAERLAVLQQRLATLEQLISSK